MHGESNRDLTARGGGCTPQRIDYTGGDIMKLYELFEVIDDYTNVYVRYYDDIISQYDGRNSIDERLNGWDVIGIEPMDSNSLVVDVLN